MKIKVPLNLSNIKSWEELRRYVSQTFSDLIPVFNGNISLTENCATSIVSFTFSAANTQVSGKHGLGKEPTGYLVVGRSSNFQVFDGSSANTSDTVYLQSSGSGTARVLVF